MTTNSHDHDLPRIIVPGEQRVIAPADARESLDITARNTVLNNLSVVHGMVARGEVVAIGLVIIQTDGENYTAPTHLAATPKSAMHLFKFMQASGKQAEAQYNAKSEAAANDIDAEPKAEGPEAD